ncbi:hypothetical protein B0H14DRAFT_3468950 [Mycena olivaceomarginata]|nr:hypothetical protein B0H14DRAFT_3468950 [Mycena olivaceomarginata]
MPLFMTHAPMNINTCCVHCPEVGCDQYLHAHKKLQIPPPASHRHFTSPACRLGCIFAHMYFHHCKEFEQPKAESSLYAHFLALMECFDLVPADFLIIPT